MYPFNAWFKRDSIVYEQEKKFQLKVDNCHNYLFKWIFPSWRIWLFYMNISKYSSSKVTNEINIYSGEEEDNKNWWTIFFLSVDNNLKSHWLRDKM